MSTSDGGAAPDSVWGDGRSEDTSVPPPAEELPIDETPCESDALDLLEPGQTFEVACTLDLRGETVELPARVSLVYAGGQILGGHLHFESEGTIDGDLLHQGLTLDGDVQLLHPTFRFWPERWDVIQGRTNSDRALLNTLHLESLFERVHGLGGSTFEIHIFDAFFEVTRITPPHTTNFYPHKEAINLPSDFTLEMSEHTHLRIFPAEGPERENGAILSVSDVSNVTVRGGTLHGDRDQREYTPADTGLEGSHLFYILSGVNVTLDGIRFLEGSKGGLNIQSRQFTDHPDYVPSQGIRVANCEFTDIRRMAISLTDGRDIVIEGNSFTNTANPSVNSDGGEVGYAINIEAARTRNEAGELIEYEKVTDVVIRNNTDRGGRGGFLTVSIGQNVTVEDNDLDGRVVLSLTNGSRVVNNRFTAITEVSAGRQALFMAGGHSPTVFDNEIAHNTISGYAIGVATSTRELSVHDNTIIDGVSGIQISDTLDTEITNNTIAVSRNGFQLGNSSAGRIEIRGNTIDAGFRSFALTNTNQDPRDESFGPIEIVNNTLSNPSAKATIATTSSVVFRDNVVHGGIELGNTSSVEVVNNRVMPQDSDGIRIYGANTGLRILGNTVSEPTGAERFLCIANRDESPMNVTVEANICR